MKKKPISFETTGEIKIVMKWLYYFNQSVRFWTINKDISHCIMISHCPEFPEVIGCRLIECSNEERALEDVRNALYNKMYGSSYYYTNSYGHHFCYTVHYPRFKSEKTGFINFHCIEHTEKVKDLNFSFPERDSDYQNYMELHQLTY